MISNDGKTNAQRLREGLTNHIRLVAGRGREKYKDLDTIETLKRFLKDSEVVRFRTELQFDENGSKEDRAVRVDKVSDDPESYRITVHPIFKGREKDVAALALSRVVKINYGKIAKEKEAALFVSTLLDMEPKRYSKWYADLNEEVALAANKPG